MTFNDVCLMVKLISD